MCNKKKSMSNGIADAIYTVNGVNARIAQDSSLPTHPYQFREPKNTLTAALFPSRDTYHQLYNADNLEVFEHLISIEASSDKSAKQKAYETQQIINIVGSTPKIRDRARIFWTCVLLLLILIIVYASVSDPWSTITTIFIIGGILLGIQIVWSLITLRGRQERAKDSISRPLSARKGAGQTTLAALQDLHRERQQQRVTRHNNYSRSGNGFLWGFLFSSLFY